MDGGGGSVAVRSASPSGRRVSRYNPQAMLTAFYLSLVLVFIAELGDRTQLVALAFATRYSAWTVLWGVFVATLVVHLGSVALGEAAGAMLPVFWVRLLGGVAFLGFGAWTLRGDSLGDESQEPSRFGPFLTVAVTFFIAEVGDKTMLATVTIASQQQSFVGVWLGSTTGMVLSDGIAILIGRHLGKSLPERTIRLGAAAVFFLSGFAMIAQALLAR